LHEAIRNWRGTVIRLWWYHSFPAILDDVAGVVAEPLCLSQRSDQRLCLDGQESLFQAFIQEGVASFADDDIGNFVQISS